MKRIRMVRHARVAGLLVLVVGMLGISTGTGSASSAAAAPKKGGTLTYLHFVEPTILWGDAAGPRVSAKSGAERMAILDALVAVDTKGNVVPRLASLTTTDGITWTMKMTPGAMYSDNTPVDAASVKYNWDLMADPANAKIVPSGVAAFKNFASWVVTDPATLTITLKTQYGLLPQFIATSTADFIGSSTALKAMGMAAFQLKPVGAGAFVVSDWTHGSQLTLTKNPNYFVKGLPYLDKLVFKYVPDDTQRYNSLVAGGGDVDYTAVLQTQAKGKDAGYVAPGFTPPGGVSLVFNSGIAPFNDIRARQALSMAIDVNGLNQAVYGGLNVVTPNIWPKGTEYYDKAATQLKSDPKAAQKLFDTLAAEGKPVKFAFMVTDAAPYPAVVQYIAARLASFQNVTMTINQVSSTAFLGPYLAKSYQIFTGAFITDPTVFFNQFTATGSSNYFNYSNPLTDQALKDMSNATTLAARKKALATAQELVVKDVGFYFMLQSPVYAVYKKSVVGGFPLLDTGMPDWSKVWRLAA